MDIAHVIEAVGTAVDIAGVGVIVVGALGATALFLYRWVGGHGPDAAYRP
ncbi:hypothetical protein [Nocardiopsis sp. HUAS JQ3]|nr:hypothetical protein [Nocardiopsis sp. HUAS JQ3]WDZ92626.1 hypothetical protein PV789_08935 [Nocardiopsis sp. HUAS JQ3]